MKKYKYNTDATHEWAIFVEGSEADPDTHSDPDTSSDYGVPGNDGGIIGTSEWIWMSEETGRRIVALLNHFEGISTEDIEKLNERPTI